MRKQWMWFFFVRVPIVAFICFWVWRIAMEIQYRGNLIGVISIITAISLYLIGPKLVTLVKRIECPDCGGKSLFNGKYLDYEPDEETSRQPVYQCRGCHKEWSIRPWDKEVVGVPPGHYYFW